MNHNQPSKEVLYAMLWHKKSLVSINLMSVPHQCDHFKDFISEVNIRGQRLTWGHTRHLIELGVVDEVGPVPMDEGAERQAILPASPCRSKGQKVQHVTKNIFG